MTWQPIELADLRLLLQSSTDELSAVSKTLFEQLTVSPYQVNCRRPGLADPERVYVVAQSDRLLLIYDDVENRFGVGRATVDGNLLKWDRCGSLESALSVLTENYERPSRATEFEALFEANPNTVFRG